jgi:hypothetical protein
MLIEFVCDADSTYATLQPQPSRVSLRKKRIRKAASGYVDLLFYLGLEYGTYVKTADLRLTSDGLYPIGCNFKINVLDLNKQNSYGYAVFSVKELWHVGEKVTIGDSSFNDSTRVPLADVFNRIISDPAYVKNVTAVYLRISFDRENYYTWDRGFFIRPEQEAPRLLLDIGGFTFCEQGFFAKIEDPLPAPCIQSFYIYSAIGVVGNQQLYVSSAIYYERDLYLASYKTVYYQLQKVYTKSSNQWGPQPPSPPISEHAYWTERDTFWISFSGDLTTQKTIYFPHTISEQEDYYINGVYGSDDFTVDESRSLNTPLRTLEGFFDYDGGAIVDDYDIVHLTGVAQNQLIFNFNITDSTATTPVTLKSEDGYTIINGHIATDGSSRISSVVFEKLVFTPSKAIDSDIAAGTTQYMMYLRFINPSQLDYNDPNYYLLFKDCKFLIPGDFPNSMESLLYINAGDATGIAKIIVFDKCLFGIDGHGRLWDAFVSLSSYAHTMLVFRNCSFFNAFNKKGYSGYNGAVMSPRVLNFPKGNPGTDTRAVFANCAFWNVEYSADNTMLIDYLRCYNGDPSLISNLTSNSDYGKYKTTSVCYRKWMPGYGNNIGWDQDIPAGFAYHRTNIYSLGGGVKHISSNIAATFTIKDRFMTNIEVAYGRYPYIADTHIMTQYSERLHKIASFIGPLDKTLIARQNTSVESSFPISTDVLYTNLPLIYLPKLKTDLPLYKENLSTLSTHIQTGWDTQCPLVLRYGIPEWYEPVFGPKFYYYFDIYDSGTGVDISSLEILWNGTRYKYGSLGVRIQPITADKTAYRIEFTPQTPLVDSETIHDIDITIYDCARNKGPIWDARRASEVLHWDVVLTPTQRRNAMIPCFFTLYWKRDRFFVETFERFRPPTYNVVWRPRFTESYEAAELGVIFTEFVYSDSYEIFDPYRVISMETLIYTIDEPTYSTIWVSLIEENIDNMVEHDPISWVPILIEEDPDDLIFESVLYESDAFEWLPTIQWDKVFDEGIIAPEQMTLSYFEDSFNWETIVSYTPLYSEIEPSLDVVWDTAIYSEAMEWWSAYIIMSIILWNNLFTENNEWFSPYKTTIEWTKIAEESREPQAITWIGLHDSSFEESYSTSWTILYDSDIEFAEESLTQPLHQEGFEWSIDFNLTDSLFTDRFEIINPATISTNIYEDDLEWMEGMFAKFYTENCETDFLPYNTINWSDVTYTEIDPSYSIGWSIDLVFTDDYEQAHPDFKDFYFYHETYEYLGQISYLLERTYMFELVYWSDVNIYEEDYEYQEKLNYFDPFIEEFEWEPILLWQTTPALLDDAELNKMWAVYFVEDLENW